MTKSIDILLFLLLVVSVGAFLINRPAELLAENPQAKSKIKSWLCYYGNRFGPDIYSRFDLAVFDGTRHPPLEKKKNGLPILLGYVSVGEVDRTGPFWHLAEGKPFILHENHFWNSRLVDVRHPGWHRILFEKAIPAVFEHGFDGLFLDTFDSTLSLAAGKTAKNYEGVETALVEITRRIKKEYPDKFIAVNRGLPILPAIASVIDYIVVEDLYCYYSDEKKAYVRIDPDTRNILLHQIEEGMRVNPDLTVLSLDYAEENQTEMIREAIAFSKKRGFIPYVSTYRLDEIFFHTLKP